MTRNYFFKIAKILIGCGFIHQNQSSFSVLILEVNKTLLLLFLPNNFITWTKVVSVRSRISRREKQNTFQYDAYHQLFTLYAHSLPYKRVSLSRGVSVQGVSLSRVVSVQGGCLFPVGVSLSRVVSLSRGDLCPGGGVSVWGFLSKKGLCPGGLCLGVSVQEGSLSKKGLCPGGLCLGVSVQEGSLSRGSLSKGVSA